MKLTVLMPVYNEAATVEEVVRRVLAVPVEKEVLVVDDASDDGTSEVLLALVARNPGLLRLVRHEENRGKGAAIRTGLPLASGEAVAVQDADLEYPPEALPEALSLIASGAADAVFGSRFLTGGAGFTRRRRAANRLLTGLTNLLASGRLTDMETGMKVVRTGVLRALDLRSRTFDFEVEVSVKLLRGGYRVLEIPIDYVGRGFHEGKKLTWRDGLRAVCALAKWGLLARRRPRR